MTTTEADEIEEEVRVRRIIDGFLTEFGVYDKLQRLDNITGIIEKYGGAVDTAFKLIENDPHSWSARPCQTCTAVSTIIGRPFGCSSKKEHPR